MSLSMFIALREKQISLTWNNKEQDTFPVMMKHIHVFKLSPTNFMKHMVEQEQEFCLSAEQSRLRITFVATSFLSNPEIFVAK